MADLKCLVVTPEETALEEMADFVALHFTTARSALRRAADP